MLRNRKGLLAFSLLDSTILSVSTAATAALSASLLDEQFAPYYYERGCFDLAEYYRTAPQNFKEEYRFPATDFMMLPDLIKMPAIIQLDNRIVLDTRTALAITLRYLASGHSQTSLSKEFGRSRSEISRMYRQVCSNSCIPPKLGPDHS
jgi:hypothetical protein